MTKTEKAELARLRDENIRLRLALLRIAAGEWNVGKARTISAIEFARLTLKGVKAE